MTLKKKQARREAIYQAIEALQIEIQDREHALEALEVVYFGEGSQAKEAKAAKVKKTEEKAPRGSTTTGRKKSRKGRAWTPEQKAKAAATRAATKRAGQRFDHMKATAEKAPAAGPAARDMNAEELAEHRTGAHEALAAKSQAEVQAATNGPNPGGTLQDLKLAPAIRAILGKAARPLTSTEIMERLKVGGYQHTAAGPLVNSVTGVLSGMGLQYERRAGRNFYEPIRKEGQE